MTASKSRRAPLTRDDILRAALDIVDREGLDALSMRRIGAALGVEAMSLYNHVPDKAALLDGIHERILEAMDPPRRGRTWLEHARHQGRALRRVLIEHPKAVVLFATRPAVTPSALARFEEHLGVLHDAGFTPLHALYVVQSVAAFVVGHTLAATGGDGTRVAYEALDPAVFPHVRAVAALLARYDSQREFEQGLDALLEGFRTSLASK